jgi:hypothetical protein
MSKFKKPYNRTVHRLREIERIIKGRYGILPDTDDADIFLNQVACCQLQMRRKKLGQLPEFDDLVGRLKLWCERWAPQASILECRDAAVRRYGDEESIPRTTAQRSYASLTRSGRGYVSQQSAHSM